ncbi:hypothetical protein [Tepidanaerobacter syntrophicus]|uniref:hypothetical protein n=1 Tax=Tepidanaerobacter syntrophicus TaxID=224999 RepID=UPI001BD5959F|nr:hypothetical protein [Tepidanaerobacter syntrophicus]
MENILWAILFMLVGIAFPTTRVIIIPIVILLAVGALFKGAFSSVKYSARCKSFERDFQGKDEQIFASLAKILCSLGYKIELLDKDIKLIVFKTGMTQSTSGQDGSIIVEPAQSETCSVQINMSYDSQITDWGEGENIADKIFNALKKEFLCISPTEDEDKESKESLFMSWWNANKNIK